MDRIIQMVIRTIIRQLTRKGMDAAMKAGGNAMNKRKARKGQRDDYIDQDPAVTERRRRHPDERRGDEILYPTDRSTEEMQPRK